MRHRLFMFLALAMCWCALPQPASAQTITCESHHNRRQYCQVGDTRGGVELVRQISRAPCERGRSWGYDDQGIWVDRGCKGEFSVSSYRGRGPWWWNSGDRRSRSEPDDGACFYKDAHFRGDYFCMRIGESFDSLPSGFNDKISSIRLQGRVRVTLYNDDQFRGISLTVDRSVEDLSHIRKQDDPHKTWNDRVSSIRVD